MKTTDLQSQISDLKINLGVYRGREKDLLERSGVVKSITSLAADLKKTEKSLTIQKSTTKKLRKSREDALQGVCLRISTQIDNFLTVGTSSIEITEGKVKIGWIIANKFHPISSLSGGEQVEFLQAFSQVIMSEGKLKLNFIELAESGQQAENILKQIIQASNKNNQTIACNWMPSIKAEGWQIRILPST